MDRTDAVTAAQEPVEPGVIEVVLQALRAAELPVSSLKVAIVADELLRLGCRLAGVERRQAELARAVQEWRDLQSAPFVMPAEMTELAIALDALTQAHEAG